MPVVVFAIVGINHPVAESIWLDLEAIVGCTGCTEGIALATSDEHHGKKTGAAQRLGHGGGESVKKIFPLFEEPRKIVSSTFCSLFDHVTQTAMSRCLNSQNFKSQC